MRHKNSFPPRLTAQEAEAFTNFDPHPDTVQCLVNRGLLRIEGDRLLTTRRGELMLTRYRIDNGIRELAKLTRKAA